MIELIEASYQPFFTEERIQRLEEIEVQIGSEFTPVRERIFHALSTDLSTKKVVWLGQDPYFQPGVANGRSFQPANLVNWSQKFSQVSLKNIIRLVYASMNDITSYQEIPTYKQVLAQIESGAFMIKQPREWFDSLESQGVMFLNASLTCRVNEPNSHKKLWEPLMQELLSYIGQARPDLIWFLWGTEAMSKREWIQEGVFYQSRHPMMCSVKYEEDFLKSRCFVETKEMINWLG